MLSAFTDSMVKHAGGQYYKSVHQILLRLEAYFLRRKFPYVLHM